MTPADRLAAKQMRVISCETCRFWDTSVSSGEDDKDRTGRCAVNPPSVDYRTGRGLWPITDADDYCYEWEVEDAD